MADYPIVPKTMMPTFEAADLPPEVEEDCTKRGISTHCENALVNVWWADEGGPLVEWLKAQGVVFKDDSVWFGLFGT